MLSWGGKATAYSWSLFKWFFPLLCHCTKYFPRPSLPQSLPPFLGAWVNSLWKCLIGPGILALLAPKTTKETDIIPLCNGPCCVVTGERVAPALQVGDRWELFLDVAVYIDYANSFRLQQNWNTTNNCFYHPFWSSVAHGLVNVFFTKINI